ncbi:NADH-quinone oxidoreductase subunit L [Pseudobacteroides cellulosolvens]|uniref:NADH dehydrogenase (Quinone) n=1 Tax=Pseudobacteroides cellulosolvens ATCC 35603 = DSM 2933 TaxID=398512 RepID=A0A0L6JVD0_9FIRM|nr:NADH-quinone oxidoreductase subunit L [Pseudobacteroides cellulosolvens]KNY29684.1 NADH dehydrogenase (quinone) [Pseudobacteroides cellulosolvens ATCC 35603 = DSM 2933]
MEPKLLAVAILLPAVSAVLCYLFRKAPIRNVIVVVTALIMFAVAGGFFKLLFDNGGKITIELHDFAAMATELAIKILDLLLFIYIMYIGVKLKKPLIVGLTFLQLIPVLIFEFIVRPHELEQAFVIDYLSLILILLVSIIGPIITIFAIGYMKEHEHHLHLKKSRQHRFFLILFVFLGAMNGLVMTNNIMWLYFFWEVTTLCSFLLISHDGNEQSIKNATRALIINMVGGVAFILGIIAIYQVKNTLAIDKIASVESLADVGTILPLGLGLLCFAGFTKSAQFPFQSWLLGAMVAPTPVSAMLHSSTMVKAGVYLIVRLAPAYYGTNLAKLIAVVGGFTFVAGSAIAISQSNGKRVLAYSTIANLGLIVCCAGLGNPVALGAAILLIIFHAVSKGLLFLCVGTIEQGIGSRDIEDMQGLMKRMPFTAVITVIGMISMLLPPFGVLISKWLTIEAAVDKSPIVLILVVLGSAFTVVFWAKWIGIVLTMSYKAKMVGEKLSISIRSALSILFVGVLACSIGIAPLYNNLILPQLQMFQIGGNSVILGINGGLDIKSAWLNGGTMGGFGIVYFFIVVLLVMFLVPVFMRRAKPETMKTPYLCGENTTDTRGIDFMSPGDKIDQVIVHNYYLEGFFGEKNLTLWVNLIAGAIILIMFGVVI